ncbi:deoxycytidylate deaminase [Aliivibrio sp. S3MY1]|uniref:deoxycytidylate deaminase n=1 Tax=unclassified Aliivibrio TaxID=2645654 RepID=UPI002377D543|nr:MULTISPECIES: deoxycytidylate deaminase [unclassified Aliivibrio]MDD9194357.1 deoxycytidylate deaminase [Aliivibrio sp. S3MY1]MDD9198025.1 deoxycytidylate deaminase [Aliivibrio sp. S2MY1]
MNRNVISNLLSERSNFIVLGLTGRTGSGCTTTASLLEKGDLVSPVDTQELKYNGTNFFTGLNQKRYEIVKKYTEKNKQNFTTIKVSELISAFILDIDKYQLIEFIKQLDPDLYENIEDDFHNTEKCFIKYKKKMSDISDINKYILNENDLTRQDVANKLGAWQELIHKFSAEFKNELGKIRKELYVTLYQEAGDSIRSTGKISTLFHLNIDIDNLYKIPRVINKIIKIQRYLDKKLHKKTYIVIDAIRNPYEAKYFKDRYSAFYLMSINTIDEDRKKYLTNIHKFTTDKITEIDKKESGKSIKTLQKCDTCNDVKYGVVNKNTTQCEKKRCNGKYSEDKENHIELLIQNVKKCVEISDIHIFNPKNEPDNHNILKAQLAWYTSLMKHPGLVTPTALERVMQIAYTAKMNSGCISRQVGAVVTDVDYSIKSVGWNDVATGQVPCNLRSLCGLKSFSSNIDYSLYERQNKDFRSEAEKKLNSLSSIKDSGRNLSYCFKSIQNTVDNEKNQVHTRSLHAEENAFLQLAKYGSAAIKGGKLFTTASPCELCAKKAYQLGIEEVIYIDPYPGIAMDHILNIGSKPPSLIQFRGAVGSAYHKLYEPLMPYKDELEYLTIT